MWSHGYSPRIDASEPAPVQYREMLLAKGYALLASDYGAAGWSLEQAVPAQRAAIAAFAAQVGTPRRVIAWGSSMGGLITTALAEQGRPAINGALAMCPSIGGAVGMMNMALDGAFAFTTLAAPNAGLKLLNIKDDMANSRLAQAVLDAAMKTPDGRARVALAGVLGGIPGWTRTDRPRPLPADVDGQVDEIAATFVMGTFLPRNDQESRAGGAFSWNAGIDYTRQLALSGRRAFVEALYAKAGLSLSADLARLNAAPRLTADPKAVQYMLAHYTPDARPRVPLVSLQAIGDGLTSPSLQRSYVEAADPTLVQGLWFEGAGHCRIPADKVMAALSHLERRLASGRWAALPKGMVRHTPPPMLRPCIRGRRCR